MRKAAELSPETSNLRSNVSINTLADMFTAIVEGGIVLARNFEDNQLLVDQVLAYRTFNTDTFYRQVTTRSCISSIILLTTFLVCPISFSGRPII